MSDDTANTGKSVGKGSKTDKKKGVPEIPPGTPIKPGDGFPAEVKLPES